MTAGWGRDNLKLKNNICIVSCKGYVQYSQFLIVESLNHFSYFKLDILNHLKQCYTDLCKLGKLVNMIEGKYYYDRRPIKDNMTSVSGDLLENNITHRRPMEIRHF